MSRSAADMISADGSGERLLSLRMNLDKTPMHAHGTWRLTWAHSHLHDPLRCAEP